jgi:ribonuclease E
MIEEDSIKENTAQIVLQLSNEAATYMLNEKRGIITDIEQRQHVSILIIPNPNIQYPSYQIKRLRKTDVIEQGTRFQTSYKLIETAQTEAPAKKVTAPGRATEQQPVVKNLLPTMPPAPTKKPVQGLIKKLWASMVGTTTTKEKEMRPERSQPYQEGRRHRPPQSQNRPSPRQRTPRATQKPGTTTPRTAKPYEPREDDRRSGAQTEPTVQRQQDRPEQRDRQEGGRRRPRSHDDNYKRRDERGPRPDLKSPKPEIVEPAMTTELQPPSIQAEAPKQTPEKTQEQAPIIIRPEVKEVKNEPTSPNKDSQPTTTEHEQDK